jgi:hypothetical protein
MVHLIKVVDNLPGDKTCGRQGPGDNQASLPHDAYQLNCTNLEGMAGQVNLYM